MTGCSTQRTSARSRRSSCRISPRCPKRNARQLRAFVERGGGLVATYETSLYDEWGVKRKDFGLAELFGVTFKGRIEGPMQNSYLRLETDPATGKRHPLLAGLGGRAAHHQRRSPDRGRSHRGRSRIRR